MPASSLLHPSRAAALLIALLALPNFAAAQTAPAAPTHVVIVPADRELHISWAPSVDDDRSSSFRYEMCIVFEGEDLPDTCPLASQVLIAVPLLVNTVPDDDGIIRTRHPTRYLTSDTRVHRVGVRARIGSRISEWADATGSILTTGTVPSAPRDIEVTGADRQVRVNWRVPFSDGSGGTSGMAITRYEACIIGVPGDRVPHFDETRCAGPNLHTYDPTAASVTQRIDVPFNALYQVSVRAVNNTGAGPYGVASSGSPVGTAVLDPPTIRSVQPLAESITVVWTPPAMDVDAQITGYGLCIAPVSVAYSPFQCPAAHRVDNIGVNERRTTINALPNGDALEIGARYNIRMLTEHNLVASPAINLFSHFSNPITARLGHTADEPLPEVLPDVVTAVIDSTNRSITARIGAVDAGDCNPESLPESFSQSFAEAVAAQRDGSFSDHIKRAFRGNGHAMALVATSGDCNTASGGLWASGAYSDLGGEDDDLNWDGELLNVQLGMDTRTENDTVIGAAASWSDSEWQYTVEGGGGEQQMQMKSLHPYLAWRAGGADFWASVGFGRGDLESKYDDGSKGPPADVDMISMTLGSAFDLTSAKRQHRRDDARFRGKAELQGMDMDVDYADDAGIADLELESRRVRVAVEWSEDHHDDAGITQNAIEGGVRYDGGDGKTGTGFEIGLRSSHNNRRGTSSAVRARVLITHSAGHEEWGVSGIIRHAPGADGQGAQWSIEPSWGDTQSGVDRLWNTSARALASTPDDDADALLSSEFGYGIAYNEGMMTPYSGFRFASDGRDYRIGARYKLRPIPLEMGLEAYRNERAAIENGVLLKASIHW